ncbi:MAG TPA: ABC transporter ATP-binding protein [Candidatus Acidoferrales bacterium]|jgi:ABC-type polysaccharide/polyol phosphate transport system ATPase subunit|nr:ABC transporter ATP-binding protein [Candidatus Acidoferrales bacterium]
MSVVAFQGVSKYFYRHGGQMLIRDRLRHLLRPEPRERFFALRDVSFTVGHGESLAIVGQNGAGKSTLLNIATQLCSPSEGTVRITGRVAALLELGAGFHGDLTGTENVRINAALLGLTRQQVNQRFDSIVEFSSIGDFIDEPLRTYSSGMRMRLAFSVAVNVDPDILIIDEVLGVGDQQFFAKCFEKIMEFRRAGKTLLCVSHGLQSLEILCDRALWLDHGRVARTGPIRQVIQAYSEASGTSTPAAATYGSTQN